MPNGSGVEDWASVAGLIIQGGFAFFLWYFVTKYIPRREEDYRADVKAFLTELAEERKARERDQQAYMQSLTILREDSFKMRQEDRAATSKFFETLLQEFWDQRQRDKADRQQERDEDKAERHRHEGG